MFWANRRLHGSYAETGVEEVIEANRRGTGTVNAVTGNLILNVWLGDYQALGTNGDKFH